MTNKKPIGHKVPRPRLLYIDNLRILLTILVIMHHFAIGYGGPGGFYYSEDGPMSMAKLVQAVGGPRDVVMQALGWLAREDKICIEEEGRSRIVSLRETP